MSQDQDRRRNPRVRVAACATLQTKGVLNPNDQAFCSVRDVSQGGIGLETGQPALFIDLDSVIVGPLDDYFSIGAPGDVYVARNWARPLDKPAFRAWPIISSNVLTFGGLKVDPEARVVNQDGEVVQVMTAHLVVPRRPA